MSKIALVTGASRGLGLETARRLGRRDGYKVIVGARDVAAGEHAVRELRDDDVDAEMVIPRRHLTGQRRGRGRPRRRAPRPARRLQTGLGGPDNRAAAPTTAAEGAEIVVEMACLPDDGPTGSFVDRDGAVAW